jgi:hypothetical protein
MSAPQTNLPKQRRRHRGPLIGLVAVVLFAVGLIFWLAMRTADQGTPVERSNVQIDGRTGEPTDLELQDPTQPPSSDDARLPGTPPPDGGTVTTSP